MAPNDTDLTLLRQHALQAAERFRLAADERKRVLLREISEIDSAVLELASFGSEPRDDADTSSSIVRQAVESVTGEFTFHDIARILGPTHPTVASKTSLVSNVLRRLAEKGVLEVVRKGVPGQFATSFRPARRGTSSEAGLKP